MAISVNVGHLKHLFPSKPEAHLYNIYKLSPYLKENTTRLHCKDMLLFKEIIGVYSVSNKKPVKRVYGQNTELLNVKQVVHIITTDL
jgi:hypothetical protein